MISELLVDIVLTEIPFLLNGYFASHIIMNIAVVDQYCIVFV